ncbi:4'-phosphopantetheinyl transferase family protein [Marinibacterium sp. SX1]|uniref:4'-phosphopantetheinyl transferase family protein n=1 Tax=Marinibacterium sp. SX1 TaxID=3388424 RepID=UPI003D1708B6
MTDDNDVIVMAAPVACVWACAGAWVEGTGAPEAILDAGERDRAGAFVTGADRRRFVAAHWLKRQVLGQITGRDPAGLAFGRGANGKPVLSDGPAFNISHGGDWVALAIGLTGPVGVDVEIGRDEGFWQDVRPVVTGPGDGAFDPLRLWTAKEAALKCRGTGFLMDPRGMAIVPDGAGFVACPVDWAGHEGGAGRDDRVYSDVRVSGDGGACRGDRESRGNRVCKDRGADHPTKENRDVGASQADGPLFGQWRMADDLHCLAVAAPVRGVSWRIIRRPEALAGMLAELPQGG